MGFWSSHSEARHSLRFKEGEVIVKLRAQPPAPGKTARFTAMKSAQNFYAKAAGEHRMRVKGAWADIGLHHMEIDRSKTVSETIDELSKLPEVEYAEPNYILEKADVSDFSGQAYTQSQVLSFVGFSYGVTTAAIFATETWGILSAGPTQTPVAVIDTGIDFNHTAFNLGIWTNPGEFANNGIDDDHNGYIDDVNGWNFVAGNNNPTDDEGHGTHVAGIVLATAENIFTTPVVAPKISVMPLKFLDSNGAGTTSDAIKAVYYAANNGAKVVNNSWGGGGYSTALAEAIAYAYQKDVVFVAAAGNSGTNNDTSPMYPANYDMPNVVPVSATDDTDVMAGFSNFGAAKVPLASPGVGILSAYPGNYYAYLSGTSMASPFVAGVAGLMRAERPAMNCYQIRNLLLQGVDVRSTLAGRVTTSGRLNVLTSVSLAQTAAIDANKPAYFLQINPADRGLASAMAGRGGCGMVHKLGAERALEQGLRGELELIVVWLALLLLPIMVFTALRTPARESYKRKYDRFKLVSDVRLNVGGQSLVGSVKTISMGGTELNTEAMLSEGSVVKMQILGPDGKSTIEVEGHIVWSAEQKRYGVAFDGISDLVKSQIGQWTKGLTKA